MIHTNDNGGEADRTILGGKMFIAFLMYWDNISSNPVPIGNEPESIESWKILIKMNR